MDTCFGNWMLGVYIEKETKFIEWQDIKIQRWSSSDSQVGN